MNNYELSAYLSKNGVRIVCADNLPADLHLTKQTFWVVNTDKCAQKGWHWVVFHFPSAGPKEFYDSLGKRPEHYQERFRNILLSNGPCYLLNTSQIQSETSNVCGHYCIYFIFERVRGRSMKRILSDFNVLDLTANDRLVYDFVKHIPK